MTEKYYICMNCGELIIESQILEDCKGGGTGMCYCQFIVQQWDEKYDKFEPIHFRMFQEYTEIPKKVFEGLLQEKNHVLRLEMLRSVPLEVLKKLERRCYR